MSKKKKFNFKENLDLHKMDDQSRRAFLQKCGVFMGFVGVSSIVRLETMEKLSKKIFGSSLAFAQTTGNPTPTIVIGTRAGMSLSYVVGFQSSDYAITGESGYTGQGFRFINQPYAPGATVRESTATGADLVLPVYNQNLMEYKNGISANHDYVSGSGHTSVHVSVCGHGDANVLSLAAAQNTSNVLLSNPTSFTNISQIEYPSANASFAPQYHTNLTNFVSQFTKADIVSGDGSTLAEEIKNSLFGVLSQSYNHQIEKALKTKSKRDLMHINDEAAIALLQKDLADQINPNSAHNSQLKTYMMEGLSEIMNPNDFNPNPVDALIAGLRAASLQIIQPYMAIHIGIGDGHSFPRHGFSSQNDPGDAAGATSGNGIDGLKRGGYKTALAGAFTGRLIYNTLQVLSGESVLDNELFSPYTLGEGTWSDDDAQIIMHSEFGRGPAIVGTVNLEGTSGNNSDGNNIYVATFNSNKNQQIFKHTGSLGGAKNHDPGNAISKVRYMHYHHGEGTNHHVDAVAPVDASGYRPAMSSFSDTLRLMKVDIDKAEIGRKVPSNEDYFV